MACAVCGRGDATVKKTNPRRSNHGPNISPDNTKILVCCHKQCMLPDDPLLMPVQAGAALSDSILDMHRDDQIENGQCDHISEKNPTYCELTVLYWAWKNIKKELPDLEYIGINHYRRYFAFNRPNGLSHVYYARLDKLPEYRVNAEVLRRCLADFDVVVPKRVHCPHSLYSDYSICHASEDIRHLIGAVHDVDPSFDKACYDVLMRSNALAPYSMGISEWRTFSEYCTWLFDVLSVVEGRIDLSGYSPYQQRVFGFMGERLWNVWIRATGLRVRYIPICLFGDRYRVHTPADAFRMVRKDAAFRLIRPLARNKETVYDSVVRKYSGLT